jgi:aminoglycoside phosphotransferase (APT) family kinase protein
MLAVTRHRRESAPSSRIADARDLGLDQVGSDVMLLVVDEVAVKRIVEKWVGPVALGRLEGGMNSAVWVVETCDGGRFVVKTTAASDEAGLAVAAALEERQFRAGGPVRIRVTDEGELVALLRFVPGLPLTAADAAVVGETLGRAHSLLAEVTAPDGLEHWPWRWLDSSLIEAADLRRQADVVIAEAEALTADASHGILHGDPAPDAFLADGNEVGLIDWGAAIHGPLLYDLASAYMYSGPGVVSGYRQTEPLPTIELEQLDLFRRFRWVVQAWYFSWRIATDNMTGISTAGENDEGLNDARRALMQPPGAGSSR